MFTLMAARLPPGEACADAMQVMAKHRIAFVCSTDPSHVASFLNIPDLMEVGSREKPLPKNYDDQVNSSIDPGRPSFTPDFHLETSGFENTDAQANSFPNSPETPQAIQAFSRPKEVKDTVIQSDAFSNSPEPRQLLQVDSRQMQETQTVTENQPPISIGTGVLEQQHRSPVFTTPENCFGSDNVFPEANPELMDFNMPPFASPAPMYDEPVDIFDGIKPPIDLDAPHLFLGEIDLTEETVEKTAVKEEMEDGEENLIDSGAHVEPKAKGYEPMNPSPFSSRKDVFGHEQLHRSPIFATPTNQFGSSNSSIRDPSPQYMDFDMDPIGTNNDQPEPVIKDSNFHASSVKKAPGQMSYDDSDDDDVKPFKPQFLPMDPNHRVLFDVDLTENSDASNEADSDGESEYSDEMEEEEEHFSDSGAHLDANDKEYKPYKPKSLLSKKSTPKKAAAKKESFRCGVCKKDLSNKDSLKVHLRVHTGAKPYVCGVCQKAFSANRNFKRHMFTHTGEKPFECGVCQKRFREKRSLTLHSHTHTGEKPYECDVCKNRFADPTTLRRHRRTHTGDKPFQCQDCAKKFSRSPYLKNHRLRFHP